MVKKVVKIPVIAVGRLEVPELAEEVIATGKADMVALGRGLLADAQWPVKVSEGREKEIRPCIGCHEGCIWRFMQGKPLSCAVNPACGRERLYALNRVEHPGSVMVIGGGVGGMEAARVAATRGYHVVLYERGEVLGGHLVEASVPDFKKDLGTLLDWYKNQLETLGVELKMATEVSPSLVARESPDFVIVATGSGPAIPDIPGIDNSKVITSIDLLLGRKKTGEKVTVIGGGLIGCETALWLAENRKNVTILEMLPELMTGGMPVPLMNRLMLIDLLALNKVNVITGVCVREIANEGVKFTVGDSGNTLEADTVVLAAGLQSDDRMFQALDGRFPHVYTVGDCREPRNIMGAIWDGFEVGRTI